MGFKDDYYSTPIHPGHNPYLQEALNKINMKKLPTAEQFLLISGCQRMNCNGEDCDFFEDVQPANLIEFAKLHVQAALKAASKNAEINYDDEEDGDIVFSINKKTILNSYSLENII